MARPEPTACAESVASVFTTRATPGHPWVLCLFDGLCTSLPGLRAAGPDEVQTARRRRLQEARRRCQQAAEPDIRSSSEVAVTTSLWMLTGGPS